MRRITILLTMAVIGVSLGLGIYFVTLANRPSQIDVQIGAPVPNAQYQALFRGSLEPFGSAPSQMMTSLVQSHAGAPYFSGGKPVIVYVGAEYCQYCAVQRWALILALMRFGTFSNLHYMASSALEHDYPTFTFVASSYSSSRVVFQSYETYDRSGAPLASLPANYSSVWNQYGAGFPFISFGNQYILASTLMDPSQLKGANWTQVISEISNGVGAGPQIKQAANLITGLICKITNGNPGSVCSVYPIVDLVQGFAGPSTEARAIVASPALATKTSADYRHRLN